MDITKFQAINATRAKCWHHNDKNNWNLLEWAGAMCGEAGEAANVAKKIRRLEMELPNKLAGLDINNYPELRFQLGREVADTIIYGLIIMSELGLDSSAVLTNVFNKKSTEYGFPERAPE